MTRIQLNFKTMKNFTLFFNISLLLLVFMLSACSATRQITEGGPAEPEEPEEVLATEEARAFQQLLAENRSSLADLQASDQLEIPSVFTQEAATGSSAFQNPYQGYRIQLISTRDIQRADTLSSQFQEWIESKDFTYTPQSYVFFKQPYYRVHVGDFQNKGRAANFTKLIKQKFPDAWVVPDRIVPSNIPPNDITFTTETDSTAQQQ